MKAQAVSKAGTKIERLMEENRKIRSQVKKLISTFQGCPLFPFSLIAYRVVCLLEENTAPTWQAPMVKLYATEFMRKFSNIATEIMGNYGQLQQGSKWTPLMGRIEQLYRHAAIGNIVAGKFRDSEEYDRQDRVKAP